MVSDGFGLYEPYEPPSHNVVMIGSKNWPLLNSILSSCIIPYIPHKPMYIDNGFQPPEVLPLQNGVDGASMVRSIVNSWGKGHPLVGWCNIVAAIQDRFAMAVVMSNVLLLEAMPKKVRCQNSWLKSSGLEETYLPKDPEKKIPKRKVLFR